MSPKILGILINLRTMASDRIILRPSDLLFARSFPRRHFEDAFPNKRGDWEQISCPGCILLGLFWPFLFRLRNNRIPDLLISKRTLIHSENGTHIHSGGELKTTTSSNRKPGNRRGRRRWISRQKIPKRTRILRIPSKPSFIRSFLLSGQNERNDKEIFKLFLPFVNIERCNYPVLTERLYF